MPWWTVFLLSSLCIFFHFFDVKNHILFILRCTWLLHFNISEIVSWSKIKVYLFVVSIPCVSAGKESACNVGDLGLILVLGGSPGEGKGYLLQYSGLENSMEYIVHGVTKSRTQLSDFHFHFLCESVSCCYVSNLLLGLKHKIHHFDHF